MTTHYRRVMTIMRTHLIRNVNIKINKKFGKTYLIVKL